MYQDIKIESLDHFGNGIAHINEKIIFVSDALPDEIVDIEITEEHKKFDIAKVINYKVKSDKRKVSPCKYFNSCGGCNLLFYDYLETISFKKKKVEELLSKSKIDKKFDIEVVENENDFYYRNKISLKIEKGKIGYYEEKTHTLVEINECIIANPEINKIIENYHLLNVSDGSIVIRTNKNREVLLIIKSNSDKSPEVDKIKEIVKLVGIVYNNKTIYGDTFLYERIGGFLFKISYDAFFQVNPYITERLFKLVDSNIENNAKVLDLYSGVGTLSVVASIKAKEVISVEIVKNAILDGILNAKLNKKSNIKFILGDVAKVTTKLKNNFDILIVDPPRKGLDKKTINFIKEKSPKKIIYISCDANTLMRDLKTLEDLYMIKEYKILDMFSYSYHLESFVVLELRH